MNFDFYCTSSFPGPIQPGIMPGNEANCGVSLKLSTSPQSDLSPQSHSSPQFRFITSVQIYCLSQICRLNLHSLPQFTFITSVQIYRFGSDLLPQICQFSCFTDSSPQSDLSVQSVAASQIIALHVVW